MCRGPIELTVPGRDPGHKSGLPVYRARRLDRRDVRRVRSLPVTSPARTLLDLAGVLPIEALETAVAEARARRLVRDRDLAAQLVRGRGRRGAAALRRLLDQENGPALTRSEAERRLLGLVRAAALPAPEVNAKVGRFELDFLWRRERVVVEVDGYAYHSGKRAFERDRERDATLVASRYAVIRLTWSRIVSNPEAVIAKFRRHSPYALPIPMPRHRGAPVVVTLAQPGQGAARHRPLRSRCRSFWVTDHMRLQHRAERSSAAECGVTDTGHAERPTTRLAAHQ